MPIPIMSFSRRIALSFGAMVLLALVGILMFWYFGFSALGVEGAAEQKLAEATRLMEQSAGHRRRAIQTTLDERRGDALVMAENPRIAHGLQHRRYSAQPDLERLQRAYPDAIRSLRLVDPVSRTIRGSSAVDEVGHLFADAALVARASQPGVSELIEETTEGGKPSLVIVRQIHALDAADVPTDTLVGLLLVYLDSEQLMTGRLGADDQGLARPSASLIFGNDGRVLSRYPASATFDDVFRRDGLISSGFEGTLLVPDGKGGELLTVYRHVQLAGGLGWTLVHYQSKAVALQGLRESARAMALLAVVGSGVMLLLIALAARRLTKPLTRLSQSAMQLGGGDLSVRVQRQPTDSSELVDLSLAFNAMADGIAKSHQQLEGKVAQRTHELVRQRDLAQRYLDIARVMLIVLDRQGCISMVNRKAIEVLGQPEATLMGLNWFQNFLPERDQRAVRLAFDALMSDSTVGLEHFENCITLADGRERIVAWNSTVLRDESGRPIGTLSSGEDITERTLAHSQLQLAASVFSHAREGITITNARGTIINVNDTFTRVTGYSREEAIGQTPRILQSGRHSPEFYDQMWRDLADQGYWSGEVWNRRKNGEVYAELLTISAVRDADDVTQNYVALFTDISHMKEHQRQLEHIAHYDALTHLPNRVLLVDRLAQAILHSQRRSLMLGVAFLDLDGFKAVNDQHGHDVGDQLLIVLALRMKSALREGDTLARIGGDEFVAVLVDLESAQDSEPVLKRLLHAAAEPVELDALVLQVSASIGVTFYPQDGVDADLLMRHADQAMYIAKQAGKNRYHVFDVAHDAAAKTRREDLAHIRVALNRQEFVLYYQPKVNMKTGEVIGAEALIRWQHPERGLLPPGLFLPTIEDDPISVEVGEWVIATALAQMATWQAQGLHLPVSVNIGARQLQQSNFTSRLGELLALQPGIAPGNLELEILETSALEDIALVQEVMAACQALGVRFALDDFGTGYSSLTYLKRLPAELLKIDQSFVRDMLTDADDLAIVQGVIGLAKAFRRDVLAEGVETIAHGELLLPLGCELAQGYGIARPMPASDMPAWVAAWRPDPRWV